MFSLFSRHSVGYIVNDHLPLTAQALLDLSGQSVSSLTLLVVLLRAAEGHFIMSCKITRQFLLWRTLRLTSGVEEGRGSFLLVETSFMEVVPVGSVCVQKSVIIEVSVPYSCLSMLVNGYTYLLTVINDFLIIKFKD